MKAEHDQKMVTVCFIRVEKLLYAVLACSINIVNSIFYIVAIYYSAPGFLNLLVKSEDCIEKSSRWRKGFLRGVKVITRIALHPSKKR